MSTTYYNRSIRKLVVAFGNLFNNLILVRYNPDNSEQERLLVPIAYAPKELYVMRLEEDENLNKKVQMTLPRLSFEMTGLVYDANRKLNTNTKAFSQTSSGVISQYNPVPYNFDFNLFLYVRNIEDGTQLIERILANFTPDYTLKIDMVPEMGIVKEVPIILNTATQDIKYEGPRETDPRMIIWTLNFTVKGYIFGESSRANVITHSITTINTNISYNDVVQFAMDTSSGRGNYKIGETVYQGYTFGTATATGKVTDWANNHLSITNIEGNFLSTQKIHGIDTLANYSFTSYNKHPVKVVQIDVTPNPANANSSSSYTANTVITEYEK